MTLAEGLLATLPLLVVVLFIWANRASPLKWQLLWLPGVFALSFALVSTLRPERSGELSIAGYTYDDGRSWFAGIDDRPPSWVPYYTGENESEQAALLLPLAGLTVVLLLTPKSFRGTQTKLFLALIPLLYLPLLLYAFSAPSLVRPHYDEQSRPPIGTRISQK